MDARVHLASTEDDLRAAGHLLHGFNTAYGDPSPGPAALAARLQGLSAGGGTEVLLGAVVAGGDPAGVAVTRFRGSLWSEAEEAYLAELWVEPAARGAGLGRALLQAVVERARGRGCDLVDLSTSDDDVAACALYESEGFRQTEGEGGPRLRHYEREP